MSVTSVLMAETFQWRTYEGETGIGGPAYSDPHPIRGKLTMQERRVEGAVVVEGKLLVAPDHVVAIQDAITDPEGNRWRVTRVVRVQIPVGRALLHRELTLTPDDPSQE